MSRQLCESGKLCAESKSGKQTGHEQARFDCSNSVLGSLLMFAFESMPCAVVYYLFNRNFKLLSFGEEAEEEEREVSEVAQVNATVT